MIATLRNSRLRATVRSHLPKHPLGAKCCKRNHSPINRTVSLLPSATGARSWPMTRGWVKLPEGSESLAKLADVCRVMVVCPASLKSQWRGRINRFGGCNVQLMISLPDKNMLRGLAITLAKLLEA